MPNKRVYFANHAGAIKADGTDYNFGIGDMIHGLQTIGKTTNFNLTPITVIGQLETYEMKEELPDVQVTLSKFLDGWPLMYHMATQGAASPTLGGRSTAKCIFGMAIYPDTNDAAEGQADSVFAASGMFTNSVSYSFNTTDPFTEELTLVGNNAVWRNASGYGLALNPNMPQPDFDDPTAFDGNDDAPIGLGGVNSRENMLFETTVTSGDVNGMVADPNVTVLPPEVFGVNISGINDLDEEGHARLQSITVSVDLNREDINELGRRGPYSRTVTFPIDVTCEIEAVSHSGDMISALEDGIYNTGGGQCAARAGNLRNRTIRIAACEGTRIYLGTKNKLSSVNSSGGDAGGGNRSESWTFTNQNSFTVMHSGDVHVSGGAWWTDRAHYLIN